MGAVLYREWRSLLSYRPILLNHIVSPAIYLVAFGTIMTTNLKAVEVGGATVPYLTFFVPGLIVLQSFGRYGWLANHASNDRRWGIYRLLVTSNVSPGAYLAGKIAFTCCIAAAQVIAIALVATSLGSGPKTAASLFFVVVIVLASTTFFASLGIAIGLSTRNENQRETVVVLSAMPFTWLSSAFYNISKAPAIIRTIARVNPLTLAVDLARETYVLGVAPRPEQFIILVALAGAPFLLTRSILRKAPLVGN